MNTKPEPHKLFEMNDKTMLLGLIGLMVVVLSIGTITTIGNWGNFTTGVNTPKVISTDLIVNSTPWIDVRAYGAVCDGVTDDSAAIQAAINASAGGDVILPAGICLSNGTQAIRIYAASSGQTFRGMGKTKTTLKVNRSIDGLIISAGYTTIRDMTINGSYVTGGSIGQNGIVFHNAGQGTVENVIVRNFSKNATLFNTSYVNPTVGSSNNLLTIRKTNLWYSKNGLAVPIRQTDNNAISLDQDDVSYNDNDGAQIAGDAWSITGGNYAQNGKFGIEIGELGDALWSKGTFIYNPFIELNAVAGINGTKSKNGMIFVPRLAGGQQIISREDVIVSGEGNGAGFGAALGLGGQYNFTAAFNGNPTITLPANPEGYINIVLSNTTGSAIGGGSVLIPYYKSS